MLVLPFKRSEEQPAASYTLFGKLPNRADFVRVNASHPVALEFDGLIQRALERMTGEAALAEAVALTGPVDFQYVARDQRHVMAGVLMPSQDLAGRRYPLAAAAILPYEAIDGYLPVSPIAYEVFFDGLREQVVNAVENSVEALSCRQFLESSLRVYETADDDLQLARSVVDRFMSTEPLRQIADLLASGPRPATLQQALLNLAFYQAHLRRFDNRASNQLFLLPLPHTKGERGLIASTWLAMLTALWAANEPAAAWRGSYLCMRPPAAAAQLVVSVGLIPDSFGSVMLGAEIESSMLLDLGSEHPAWMSHRMYAEASYALGRILTDPDCRLSMLCDFLGEMSRQLEGNV